LNEEIHVAQLQDKMKYSVNFEILSTQTQIIVVKGMMFLIYALCASVYNDII